MNFSFNSKQRFCDNNVVTSKYTAFNFAPKSLFEQFRRIANVYFLIISLFQVTTNLSPTSKYATIVPLMGVIGVTMIKEAIEDYKRHHADKIVNSNMTRVIDKKGKLLDVAWRDVRVGDIVELVDGDGICCDGILLSACTDQGLAYVETSSLDGETNLKIRESCWQTAELKTIAALSLLQGRLQCELPNPNMYRFSGSLHVTSSDSKNGPQAPMPVSLQNVLLRGCYLRNTPLAYVLVAYTGRDTKQVRNTRATPSKRSNVDRLINSTIFLVFITLFAMCSVSTVLFSIWVTSNSTIQSVWYLPFVAQATQLSTITSFITFLILFNNLVPISLYVTLELVKLIQARLIEGDLRMFYTEKMTPAMARTSNLNEDLGQIEHIFCDKTGTLTCNEMVFRHCSVGGEIYSAVSLDGTTRPSMIGRSRVGDDLAFKATSAGACIERDFLRVISVCHTVLPEIVKVKGHLMTRFQASSPDEQALVSSAIGFGYQVLRRDQDSVAVGVTSSGIPVEFKFELLNINEFTSQRKCMSVVVRTPEGRLVLLCKGADDTIYSKLRSGQEQYVKRIKADLHQFALLGLRTLVMAQAELDEYAYADWNERFVHAQNAVTDNKDEFMEALSNEIEVSLTLLGATGIEDRLQDGVPNAIRLLSLADIKVWVLTGDKVETAINIGKSSCVITNAMQVIRFEMAEENLIDAAMQVLLSSATSANEKALPIAMVVDGPTLTLILDHKRRAKAFLRICNLCSAVIACRTSPKQKAGIVAMVKKLISPEPMTLAIGDGANDIGMLQEAHVGVGISGNEGMQAVNSADYALGQFRFLTRLLLVHGNWNYRRVTKVVLYSFYKNISNVFVLFFYCFFNGYSGSSLYESWLQAGWNVGWTFLPIVVFGVTDKDLHATTILQYPKVYSRGQRHELFSLKVMAKWVGNSIAHAVIVFVVAISSLKHEVTSDNGTAGGMMTTGTIINGCMTILVNYKLLLESKHWTKYSMISVTFSISFWFMFVFVYSYMIGISFDFYMIGVTLLSNPMSWLLFLLVPVAATLCDISAMYIKDTYFPTPIVIASEIQNITGLLDQEESLSNNADKKSKGTFENQPKVPPANRVPRKSSLKKGDVELKPTAAAHGKKSGLMKNKVLPIKSLPPVTSAPEQSEPAGAHVKNSQGNSSDTSSIGVNDVKTDTKESKKEARQHRTEENKDKRKHHKTKRPKAIEKDVTEDADNTEKVKRSRSKKPSP